MLALRQRLLTRSGCYPQRETVAKEAGDRWFIWNFFSDWRSVHSLSLPNQNLEFVILLFVHMFYRVMLGVNDGSHCCLDETEELALILVSH